MWRRLTILVALSHALCATSAVADITRASLEIQGAGLRLETLTVTTGLDIPITIQTSFGGRTNDEAPSVPGLVAVGDLTGPEMDLPIQLTTTPGYSFNLPALRRPGLYLLQNVRLMSGPDTIQRAVPSTAQINVADLLQPSLSVRQLTPEEIRARGIVVDERNFDVYDYSLTVLVNGEQVVVPFPVIVDRRTHVVTPVRVEHDYGLPPAASNVIPPRWTPPEIIPFEFPDAPSETAFDPGTIPPEREVRPPRPRIPAALIISGNLAVLHQFFAVVLNVTNGAPTGSTARLEDIRATMKIRVPSALRAIKSTPAVAFGQAVPVVDPNTGVTVLVAQSKGEAEWVLEGLEPGTHTVEVDILATLREAGQRDVQLRATPSAAVVIHDPRFNITFSHPDTIRKAVDYSTFAFVTNMSPSTQTIRVSDGLPQCTGDQTPNVCRVSGGPSIEGLTIPPGEMRVVEYRLRSGETGQVYATAGSINDDNITAAVQLHLGVSASGIPLSPATLVLPYYAQFIDPILASNYLQLLGLGYSLATAPLNQVTARLPRVIKTDVFYRATDLARAGQRVFITDSSLAGRRDALSNLLLDLLGNGVELREWDELRRAEEAGRSAGSDVARELRAALTEGQTSIAGAVDQYAAEVAHRGGHVFAVAHAPGGAARPLSVALRGASGRTASVANEVDAGWTRDLPFADVSRFDAFERMGELAVAGRWTEDLELVISPAVTSPIDLDLLFPGASDGTTMRAHLTVSANANETLRVPLAKGSTTIHALLSNGGIAATTTASLVPAEELTILGARQDLHLDPEGHKVSVLFSRPIAVAEGTDLLAEFHGEVDFNRDGVVFREERPIFSASLQGDQRVVNLSFDHVLHSNASYAISAGTVVDPSTSSSASFPVPVIPLIDNDRPAGILYGRFITGDNEPIPSAEIKFFTGHRIGCAIDFRVGDEGGAACNPFAEAPQYARTRSDGSFLFEYVPRDLISDPGLTGAYKVVGVTSEGRATVVEGAVRLPGRVHVVNLQLLGRGSAEGKVRYDDGGIAAGVRVHVSSTLFNVGRDTVTDSVGFFRVEDLAVGPITFGAVDADGNVGFASSEIATPGQVAVKELVLLRKRFPGTGEVFGRVTRSDTGAPVFGARVGVHSQGYGFAEDRTDPDGRFEFARVPAGFVTLQAAEWSISRESAAVDFDLAVDESREVNLTLSVMPTDISFVRVTGRVLRENPLHPGDSTRYERVPGAVVSLAILATTTDPDGNFAFDGVPINAGSAGTQKMIQAYDPSTKRIGAVAVPTLSETGPNDVTVFIPANSYGGGTIRVRVLSAHGVAVDGFRVIDPGYPPRELARIGPGVYELRDAPIGTPIEIFAVNGPAMFGEQVARATINLGFAGQVATLVLRLPGQGTVRAKQRSDFDLIGDVALTYPVWNEQQQAMEPFTVVRSSSENGVAGFATFSNVPALQGYAVVSTHPVHGYSGVTGHLAYDGDVGVHTLQLNRLATVHGIVYAIDGVTPISDATVRLHDGRRDAGIVQTQPDGTFVFRDVPAAVSFHITAEVTQSGIYRVGIAYGQTPGAGGPTPEVSVILRRRGSVEGRVVYAEYKVYDPANPGSRVVDDTPGDYSDNAPVPLARFWLRELDYPGRSFGTSSEPLIADVGGRFAINNAFTGSLRALGWAVDNQEMRGNWSGVLTDEGELLTGVYVAVGTGGAGSLEVKVVDPNQQYLPIANAEVRLYRGGLFDVATTDDAGLARFDELPAGSYGVDAYSKSLGKSGAGIGFTIQKEQLMDVRVLLEFVGKVDGRLSDPMLIPAKALPGVPVRLTASSFYALTSTDVAGLFFFEGIREGPFQLAAKDTESNRWAHGQGLVTPANRRPYVELELERTETLHVAVYLPDDSGGNSGTLAGPFEIDVRQRLSDYHRALQGNPVEFPSLFVKDRFGNPERYYLSLREIGGAARTLVTSNAFPKGGAADPVKLVYPALGSIDVIVTQAGAPASGARVEVYAGSERRSLFADSSGRTSAAGLPLGAVTLQVTSVDGRFTGSAIVTIARQSIPAMAAIELGAFAGIAGVVEAEAGGVSIGTRVLASFAGRTLEVLTDAAGGYTFQGIPTSAAGTLVSLSYVGPDGTTVGALQSVILNNDWASRVRPLATVRLDATPPQLLSIMPADGSQNVSPDTPIRFKFSERMDPADLNSGNLQLIAADGSGPVASTITSMAQADGTFDVTLRPNPHPGEPFPLRSDTLYRTVVQAAPRDLTGHRLPAPRGSTFTTSDYAEPRVLKLVPSDKLPLPAQVTLQFHFNEPIDGQAGSFHFYQLSGPGPGGAIIAEKAGQMYVDPVASLYLAFAPNGPIEPESFYRAVFTGIRDLQGNELGPQTFHYLSFDNSKPYLRLISPVPEGISLVSGVEYTLSVDARSDSTDGPQALDVAAVEFVRVDGASETFLTTARSAPFSYRFVGVEAPEAGILYTIRAVATDQSGNVGPPSTISWTVKPNAMPKGVNVAVTPPAAYPGRSVTAGVVFEDEGVLAPVQVVLRATNSDGTEFVKAESIEAKRTSVGQPWPSVALPFQLPADLKPEQAATFTATVTDVRGLSATATTSLPLLLDTAKPVIVSTAPAPETTYNLNATYRVTAVVSDDQTGVAEVAFLIDGTTYRVLASSSTTGPIAGTRTFLSPQITVTARNVDTRIPVVVRALDHHGNVAVRAFDVVYIGVNDPTAPKGAWLCPIDRAAVPALQTAFRMPLTIRAQDDVSVTGVSFRVTGIPAPIVALRVGSTDQYEAVLIFDTPAAGSEIVATAVVSDADPSHTIELPITIEVVGVDRTIDATEAVDADTVQLYEGKSLAVRGSGRLVANVPVALANLIVLDGGRVETLGTTTTRERRMNVTVAGRIYVDCASALDVTGKGYLGGWGVNPDGTGTRNDSPVGRTVGNTINGGATLAGASHGGLGGALADGATNVTYGSILDPFDLGSGGAGHSTTAGNPGGTGGGAVSLRASSAAGDAARIVVAGAIRADAGAGGRHGGSGGSVRLDARQIVIGPLAQISANGGAGQSGCGSGADQCLGGSGGRIALIATERLDLGPPLDQLRASGGLTGAGGTLLAGAAGTVHVRRPGQVEGELYVSSSLSYTRATPFGSVSFDRIVLGTFALARFDAEFAVGGIADDAAGIEREANAVVVTRDVRPAITGITVPASGATVIRNTPVDVTLDLAAAGGGVLSAEVELTAAPPKRLLALGGYPLLVQGFPSTFAVPYDAPLGPATLRAKVIDRADRAFETTISTFTVIENAAPAIDILTVLPSSLYPGGTITTTLAASDDVKLTRISASVQIGASAPSVQSRTPNVKVVTNEVFAFAVPIDTPGGTAMTVEASVEDAFPGRLPTKQVTSISILHDTIAPQATITSPADAQVFDEAVGSIAIDVSATDAEVRVRTVTAQVGSGGLVALATDVAGTRWQGAVAMPAVEGEEIAAFPLTVIATDYAGNARTVSLTIRVKPTIDPNAPTMAWICGREGRAVNGVPTKLRVRATAANVSNPVQKVEFTLQGSPTLLATNTGPDLWEATWSMPALVGGTITEVTAVATASGGATTSSKGRLVAVVPDQIFTANATIAAADLSFENKTLVVAAGSLTISGAHSFAALVLAGGSVTHAPGDQTLRLNVGDLYVACDSAIDVTGRGYGANATYAGATAAVNGGGGSHVGVGGPRVSPATSFGSIYRPQEGGGGADGGAGGGVVVVNAQTVVIDGAIRANGVGGTGSPGGGAGGSVWIRTGRIAGTGTVEANGGAALVGSGNGSGGGGAVAIEYTDATSVLPVLRAMALTGHNVGGAGTAYVKGPASVYGDLTVDNGSKRGQLTDLPSLGSGVAQNGTGGATLVTDRASNIPAYFAGHWVEITNATGTVKGLWRIDTVLPNSKTVVLIGEGIALEVGDRWRGLYLLDSISVSAGARLSSADLIRGTTLTTAGTETDLTTAIDAVALTVRGTTNATLITAADLTIDSGGLLRQAGPRLTINAGNLVVRGAIDVTGQGFPANATYAGATVAVNGGGGSHVGVGGPRVSPATSFGSIYRPQEGGGGADGGAGGGVVVVNAQTVVIDGAIRANGVGGTGSPGGGAGGSVWIRTGRIAGTGTVEANGGAALVGSGNGSGGGGAVAIEYTDATSVLPVLRAMALTGHNVGGAGTAYVKGPASVYGDLTVDNGSKRGQLTDLPSLGSGAAQNGTGGATLVTDRASNIPAYFAGHWVEITNATGTVKGLWRIDTVLPNSKTVVLIGEGIALEVGDRWRGLYLLDSISVSAGARLSSPDLVRATSLSVRGMEVDLIAAVEVETVTINATTNARDIKAKDLVVESAGTLRQTGTALTIDAKNLTIVGAIDVSAQGYPDNISYPGAVVPGPSSGGSHLGIGGLRLAPTGSSFGSIVQPRESGGGTDGGTGGGVVAITAESVSVQGAVRANGGGSASAAGGGAGGSIWIRTGKITGAGTIEANGGAAQACCAYGGGGGGAISIEYTDITSMPPVLRAIASTAPSVGGAGTVFTRAPASVHGDLIVDNGGRFGQITVLPALGSGVAQTGSTGMTLVTDRATDIPAYFVGHWVEVNGKGTWRVAGVNARTMTLEAGADLAAGDRWQGVYRVDTLRIRGAALHSADTIRYTTLDKDGAATLVMNAGAPQLAPSQLAISGDFIVGAAGAVLDGDAPIKVTATNMRTGQTWSSNAVASGSFSILVGGAVGDTFTVTATDSHLYPRTSAPVPVNGTFVETSAIASFTVPSTLPAGGSVNASIRLGRPARPGGVVIAISSSDAAVVVPGTIFIPAGNTTAQFAVTATSVPVYTPAVLSATLANTLTAALQVVPSSVALSALTIAPATAVGGASVNVTASLGSAAPAGGAVVMLASDSPFVIVPVSVPIPEGASDATITVATRPVATPSTVTITASYGNVRAADLGLTACATLSGVAPMQSTPLTVKWVDDAPPANATVSGDAAFDTTQATSGSLALHFGASATARSWSFSGAAPMTVAPSDNVVMHVLVNPCNPPRQIMAVWGNGTTEWRTSWGENRIAPLATNVIGAVPSGGEWTRLEVPVAMIGMTAAGLTRLTITVDGGEVWFDAIGNAGCALSPRPPPDYAPNEYLWFDDALPAGATPSAAWDWTTAQAASGSMAHRESSKPGFHSHQFSGATSGVTLATGDVLFAYVLVDPCNPPRQMMLQWHDGAGWEHRAYWGENLISTSDAGALRVRVGPLPQPGVWTRVEVPVSAVLLDGKTVTGASFALFDGQAWFDRVGKASRINLALGKSSSQSSTFQNAPASSPANAVDGDLTNYQHTNSDAEAWWQVDLGSSQPIESIDVWNRDANLCCQDRLSRFWVHVSDQPFAGTSVASVRAQTGATSYHNLLAGERPSSFAVNRTGRYVRVQLAGANTLHVAEVQVWAPATPLRMNMAAGRTATQSTTFSDATGAYIADLAINGNAGAPGTNSLTLNQASPWWQVDLGSVQWIGAVDVDNTSPCCGSRMSDFYLFVSDVPFVSSAYPDILLQSGVSSFYRGPWRSAYTYAINRNGRYVRIQLTGTNVLHPYEVKLWSPFITLPPMARTAGSE